MSTKTKKKMAMTLSFLALHVLCVPSSAILLVLEHVYVLAVTTFGIVSIVSGKISTSVCFSIKDGTGEMRGW